MQRHRAQEVEHNTFFLCLCVSTTHVLFLVDSAAMTMAMLRLCNTHLYVYGDDDDDGEKVKLVYM